MLRTSKRGKKHISNIFNYDILTNYRYADEFFYTQMAMREPGDLGSDYISRVIYLGAEKATAPNPALQSLLSPSNAAFSVSK